MISNCTHACPQWARAHRWGHREEQPPSNSESLRQRLAAASLSADSELSIRITTDEGDVVTLSAQREVDLTLINYSERYRSESEKSRTELRASSLSVSSNIQLSVQGDLSEEERADIEALLQDLQPAVDEFLRTGQPVAVPPTPGEEYESLAGFGLDMTSTQQLDLLAAKYRSETTEANRPAPPAAPEPREPKQPPTLADLQRMLEESAKQRAREGTPEDAISRIVQRAMEQIMSRLEERLQAEA